MVAVKAVLLDLHGTLAFIETRVDATAVSDILVSRGYNIYPQTWAAALQFVSMVDYPRHGYGSFRELVVQTLARLGRECEASTVDAVVGEYDKEKWKTFPESERGLRTLKDRGMLTAVVTTIPRWRFERFIAHLLPLLDMVVDGYTFRVEKSDPRIYTNTLTALGVEPGEAMMVGDEELTDVAVPRSIGMQAFLLKRATLAKGKRQGDGTVKTLDEIALKIGP